VNSHPLNDWSGFLVLSDGEAVSEGTGVLRKWESEKREAGQFDD